MFRNPLLMPRWTPMPLNSDPIRWRYLGLSALCMAGLTVSNLAPQPNLSSYLQFLLLLLGIGFIIYGFKSQFPSVDRRTLALVGTIALIALLLRVIALDGLIRFFVDESHFATAARLARVTDPPLLARFSGVAAFPWIYPFVESITVNLFGRNLVGLRLVSALFGTLTIPALYLLARAIFNKPVALMAALLLATFPPHIHFSRLALNNIADPLFGTLALGCIMWGWRTGRGAYFALAGVALGLTQYFYDGGRLLYLPLLIIWLAICLIGFWWRGEGQRDHLKGVFLLALTALIITAPVYLVSIAQAQPFSQRYNQVATLLTASNLPIIVQRLWDSFLFYFHSVEAVLFYGGATPLLLLYFTVPFLIGLASTLWDTLHLNYGSLLLLLWIMLTSAGNALLAPPLASTRYVVAFPALMLLAALGLYLVLNLLLPKTKIIRSGLILATITLAFAQSVYYFKDHIPLYNDQSRLYADSQDAAFRAADFRAWTQVHIIADPVEYHGYAREVLTFLRDDFVLAVLSPQDFTDAYLEGLWRGLDHAFFLLPGDTASQRLLQRQFVVNEPMHSPYPLPPNREFLLFYAPRDLNGIPAPSVGLAFRQPDVLTSGVATAQSSPCPNGQSPFRLRSHCRYRRHLLLLSCVL